MEDPNGDDDEDQNEVERPRYIGPPPPPRPRYRENIEVSLGGGGAHPPDEGWRGWLLKLTMLGIAGLLGWIANEINALHRDTATISSDLAAIKATQVATITAQAVRDLAEEQRLTTLENRVFQPYDPRARK